MIYILPILLSILPIFMINWCAKKEEEYPNIKLDTKRKKILCYTITLSILEISSALFDLYKTNLLEIYVIWFILLLLISISYIDWNTSLIPNRYSYSLIGIGFLTVIYNFITKENIFLDANAQLISFLIIFASFIIVYFISKNGVGMGDVKIIAGTSMFLGISLTALMLFISSALILLYDVVIKIIFNKKIKELPNNDLPLDSESDVVNGRIMGLSKINNRTAIVMGPFLSVAFIISYLVGQEFLNWWFILN